MIIIGVDAHKSTHTFVAIDDVGRKIGELTAKATPDGHLAVIEWAARWPQVQFALSSADSDGTCTNSTRNFRSRSAASSGTA